MTDNPHTNTHRLSLKWLLSLATLSDAGSRIAEHMAGHVSQRAEGESCCVAI